MRQNLDERCDPARERGERLCSILDSPKKRVAARIDFIRENIELIKASKQPKVRKKVERPQGGKMLRINKINYTKDTEKYHWMTDEEFKDKFKDRRTLLIGGGYRAKGKRKDEREYQRCEKLDNFTGIKIGCNTAYKTTELDVLIWLDHTTYDDNWREIRELDCLKLWGRPKHHEEADKFYAFRQVRKIFFGRSFEEGILAGNLSGVAAFNIAVLLGCNPIYITGFNGMHFKERTKNFDLAHGYLRENGIKVFNTDKDFILGKEYFPYIDLDLILV